MANDFDAFVPELWSPTMQEIFIRESVAVGVASTELRDQLSVGDRLHKPYMGVPTPQTYTKGSDITVKDLQTTDDYITCTTAKVASFYVDDIDVKQSAYPIIDKAAARAQKMLNNVLDQAVFTAGIAGAGHAVTAYDINESDTATGVVFSPSNADDVFAHVAALLDAEDRGTDGRFALVGPRMMKEIRRSVGARETPLGDMVGENGLVGRRGGFALHQSNNLPYSATLTTSATISASETVVIHGVTFTFRATAAAAGDVDLGSSDAEATANLILAINGTGTPAATTYIALAEKDRRRLLIAGITATATSATATAIAGFGDIVVSETMAQAANVWSAQTQHALFGLTGGVSLITQLAPSVKFRDAQLRLGKYVHPYMLYGGGVFEEDKLSLASVTLSTSNWR